MKTCTSRNEHTATERIEGEGTHPSNESVESPDTGINEEALRVELVTNLARDEAVKSVNRGSYSDEEDERKSRGVIAVETESQQEEVRRGESTNESVSISCVRTLPSIASRSSMSTASVGTDPDSVEERRISLSLGALRRENAPFFAKRCSYQATRFSMSSGTRS